MMSDPDNKDNLVTKGFHLPYNPNNVSKAKILRTNMTAAEKKLWYECLRTFPYRVLRQRPIDHFIVDFYCAKLKLVIEIDGDNHYTNNGLASDKERSAILEGYGLRVLRFTNTEILKEIEMVKAKLHSLVETES